ncbi:MAG: PPOX class F420-dependent oxidoreductase [Acidimicrobiales bacterium]|jgi:pyridoxamine 5'-phosphate oxidase family protein
MDLSENERNYLNSQPLGRLATLAPDGSPQSRPVGFFLNEALGTIDIGGHNLGRSQKFRNVQRDGRVTLVVDDLASIDPWAPRGIEIRGEAEALTDAEPPRPGFSSELIRIHPNRVLAWGLDSDAFAAPLTRNVEHG